MLKSTQYYLLFIPSDCVMFWFYTQNSAHKILTALFLLASLWLDHQKNDSRAVFCMQYTAYTALLTEEERKKEIEIAYTAIDMRGRRYLHKDNVQINQL